MTKTILLADDSVTIQKVVELTFMDQDYQVVAVSDGRAALNKLSDMRPDLVIADVHMPEASGYEVCRLAKQTYPGLPVLLLVGTFEPFDLQQATAAGADSHLKKPFDSQDLLREVDTLITQSSPPQPAATAPIEDIPVAAPATPVAAAPPAPAPPAPPAPAAVAPAAPVLLPEPPAPAAVEVTPPAYEPPAYEPPQPVAVEPALPLPEPAYAPVEPAPPAASAVDPPFPEFALGDPSSGSPEVATFEPEPIAPAVEPMSFEPVEPEPVAPEPESVVPEPASFDPALFESVASEPEQEEPEPAEPALFEPVEPEPAAPVEAAPEPAAVPETPPPLSGESAESNGDGELSAADVDRIARRVVDLLGDTVVRQIAWEVIPDLAEVVIKERIKELESQVE